MGLLFSILLLAAAIYYYQNSKVSKPSLIDESKNKEHKPTLIDKSTNKENKSQRKNLKQDELSEILKFELSEDKTNSKYLVFDTETTGLIKKKSADPQYEPEKFPFIVQISWILFDNNEKIIEQHNYLIKQNKKIPPNSSAIHGITNERTEKEGLEIKEVLNLFCESLKKTKYVIAHNLDFDWRIFEAELTRNNMSDTKNDKYLFCTMDFGQHFCEIPMYGKDYEYKYPTLEELFHRCFFPDFKYLNMPSVFHSAYNDTIITAKCFFKMMKIDSLIKSTIK